MKKSLILSLSLLSISVLHAQDLTDVLRYSQQELQGTARYRALSGAFGALGGDHTAVNINPASSAVFARSSASVSLSNNMQENKTRYFSTGNTVSDTDFSLNQAGATFVFANSSKSSPWRKVTFGFSYDRQSTNDNWNAIGTNTDVGVVVDDEGTARSPSNSIANYFFLYADGLPREQISYPTADLGIAYSDIGNDYGFGHQQAFLGYESFILDPDADDPTNTRYTAALASGNFHHNYRYNASGYNGKVSFNIATQYKDNLYFGLNLNSHFINYDRSTTLIEDNDNDGSLVNSINFKNYLSTKGNGFSLQLGAIVKLTDALRLGLTYDSPTWYTIEEEGSQYLDTQYLDDANNDAFLTINPGIANIYPSYKLQTPGRFSGSLAYVFGKKGLLSFDYATKNYGSMKLRPTDDYVDLNNDVNNVFTRAATYRLGGEYRIKQLALRGGYRFEESPYANGRTVGDLNGFSVGVGYNFGNATLDLTYDQSSRDFETPLYSRGLTNTASIDNTLSNVILTLSFHI